MRYHLHSSAEGKTALRQFVETLPQRFETEGRTVFKQRNEIKLFDLPSLGVVAVKRYKRPLRVQRLAYTLFRRTKARRAFENAAKMLALGFRTPMPWAWVETSAGGLFADGYLVTAVTHLPPIAEAFADGAPFDEAVATAFAHYVARLHEAGILHHDLNSTNVLYERSDAGIAFEVIDMNRMDFLPAVPLREAYENLTRFTGRMDLFAFVAQTYVSARALPPSAVEELLQQKISHDTAWRNRKERNRRLKRCLLPFAERSKP